MAGAAPAGMNELAPHHVPFFIPSADGTDPLMTVMTVLLVAGVIMVGVFYLYLHSLPERLAHKHDRMQFEVVAVLGLLALFTHNNWFWVAALLLAFVKLPDFLTPLASIAESLGRMVGPVTAGRDGPALADRSPSGGDTPDQAQPAADPRSSDGHNPTPDEELVVALNEIAEPERPTNKE
ncbi:hypothetical protein GCM10011316_37760 [Roseibium aquae]|uniref:Uncharacterized protein n=1 Tax=Roseibium aquae TaxID=1323746 RepID=A0A916X2J1_9HYPH|nr:hypothetical protein [Roseibium aquae]GGB62274.1 hypothetical protein GCM10011316_37760 [Roseibium aquae]